MARTMQWRASRGAELARNLQEKRGRRMLPPQPQACPKTEGAPPVLTRSLSPGRGSKMKGTSHIAGTLGPREQSPSSTSPARLLNKSRSAHPWWHVPKLQSHGSDSPDPPACEAPNWTSRRPEMATPPLGLGVHARCQDLEMTHSDVAAPTFSLPPKHRASPQATLPSDVPARTSVPPMKRCANPTSPSWKPEFRTPPEAVQSHVQPPPIMTRHSLTRLQGQISRAVPHAASPACKLSPLTDAQMRTDAQRRMDPLTARATTARSQSPVVRGLFP